MMMKSVFWWRKPEYPEETTDLRQVTDGTVLVARDTSFHSHQTRRGLIRFFAHSVKPKHVNVMCVCVGGGGARRPPPQSLGLVTASIYA